MRVAVRIGIGCVAVLAVAACSGKELSAGPSHTVSGSVAPRRASSYSGARLSPNDLVVTCNKWLDKVQAGDAVGSYAMFSESLQSSISLTDWASAIKVEQSAIANRKRTAASGIECDYSIVGSENKITIVVIAEDGAQRVDLYRYSGGG
jgi:hypothetical protein